MYTTLKAIHVGAVALSATGFVIRYALTALGQLPRGLVVRVVPHLVDTVLLASAIGLVWIAGLRPLEMPWLAAKIAGVVVYIVAGSFALKRGTTRAARATAFVIALGTLAWIVSVALTKSPQGAFAGVV